MAARSQRLAGPVEVPTGIGGTLLYTCPAGKTALCKSIRVVNESGGSALCRLYVGAPAGNVPALRTSVAAGTTYVDPDTDPIVLEAGENLYATTQTNAAVFTVSGAELVA